VRAACVVPQPDPRWGQVLVALVVTDAQFDLDAFAEHNVRHLASFKRPRHVALVGALPTTPAGKLDRRAATMLAASLPHLGVPSARDVC
jgi:acyl-CoA synthetase (AMP-forming)/AMP-acid ligase II